MPRITYDKEMRQSEHGRRLYSYWKNKVHRNTDSPDFVVFTGFFEWAIANGYTVCARLFRHDADEPFSPDNCFWVPCSERVGQEYKLTRNRMWEQKWDETVNRIRLHFGMEPIYSSEE